MADKATTKKEVFVTKEEQLEALVAKLDAYIVMLGEELSEISSWAHIHGWSSSRVTQGKQMRQEIEKLRFLDPTPPLR
jgi:hypothetical protein